MFTRYPVDESITERSVYVGWAPSGDVLVVTMFGGNCTPSVKKVLRTGTDEVTLLLSDDPEFIGHGQPPDRMCTANLSGYTTIIEPPTGITPAKSIVVVVNAAHHRLPSR